MFLMLHSINWPNFIVWLSLLLEIIGNRCIRFVCLSGCDVIKIGIYLIFLIKPSCYITKKSRQKLKYLENKNSFLGEMKSIFHHIKRGFSCQKMSQTWSVPLRKYNKEKSLNVKFRNENIPTLPKVILPFNPCSLVQ